MKNKFWNLVGLYICYFWWQTHNEKVAPSYMREYHFSHYFYFANGFLSQILIPVLLVILKFTNGSICGIISGLFLY